MTGQPTIIVDLDNTILDPSRRKAKAFIDAVKSTGTVINKPAIVKKIDEASRASFDFTPMKKVIDKEIDELVFRRFLSNEYLVMHGHVMDDPVPGSVNFLNDAVKNGCSIAYVSGRSYDEWQDKRKKTTPMTGMVPGTLESLQKLGYPMPAYPSTNDDAVKIMFKDNRQRKDEEYKPAKIRELQKTSDVVAVFEDNKKILDSVKKSFSNISRVAVLIYPDLKEKDYGCLPRSQRKITEFMTGEAIRGSVECIKNFSRIKVLPGCKIVVNGKKIS